MSFNGFNQAPGDVPGTIKVPCCRVFDPVTGQPMIVPATDPPQGEVFYVDVDYPALGTIGTAPSPLPFGSAASPLPFGSAASPMPIGSAAAAIFSPFGSSSNAQPYSYGSNADQYQYDGPFQEGSSYPYYGSLPGHVSGYASNAYPGNFNGAAMMPGNEQPMDGGQWNSHNQNFFDGIANLHTNAREEFKQRTLSIQPQENVSVNQVPMSSSSENAKSTSAEVAGNPDNAAFCTASKSSEDSTNSAETPDLCSATQEISSSVETSALTATASSSETPQPSSTQDSVDPVAAPDSKKVVNPEDLCDEGGPRDLHFTQKMSTKYYRGLLQAKASGTRPWVTKILIDRSRATFFFDTLEQITVSADNVNLGNVMAHTHASYCITLECTALRTKLMFIDRMVLQRFFAYTISITVIGYLAVENLEWIMPLIKVSTLNVHRWRVSHVGRLGSLTHVGLPRQLEHLYFDARGTDNPTFVDSISRLYMDTYIADRRKEAFLQSLTLVVVDFCALGQALVAQLQRLNQMLRSDVPATAAIITTQMGDDDILQELYALGFQYSHAGFIEELDGPMMKIHYWKKTAGSKSVVLGFKARKYLSRTKEEIDLIKNL